MELGSWRGLPARGQRGAKAASPPSMPRFQVPGYFRAPIRVRKGGYSSQQVVSVAEGPITDAQGPFSVVEDGSSSFLQGLHHVVPDAESVGGDGESRRDPPAA